MARACLCGSAIITSRVQRGESASGSAHCDDDVGLSTLSSSVSLSRGLGYHNSLAVLRHHRLLTASECSCVRNGRGGRSHRHLNVVLWTFTGQLKQKKRGHNTCRSTVQPRAGADDDEPEGKAPRDIVGDVGPTARKDWGFRQAKAAIAVTLSLLQACAPIGGVTVAGWGLQPAEAVLSSPDTKVPRSADVALRRSIPAVNLSMKKMQNQLEDISFLLRIPQRKPYGSMNKNVQAAYKIALEDKDAIIASVPKGLKQKGEEQYNRIVSAEAGLPRLLKAIDDKDPEKISVLLSSALDDIAKLKLLQAPGLPFLLPAQYQDLPRLTGRATVEITLKRGSNATFTVAAGGGPKTTATLEVVLDGYSAPLTAGNFADLVKRKTYDGTSLVVSGNAVLSDDMNGKSGQQGTPLEIMPAGDFQPLYRTALDVQDGELPVLPLSVFGAVAMAHDPNSETNSSASQFFFYLFNRREAGLGGLSFDEGNFSVFGYVTKGREILSQLQTGDIIESAKLVAGNDRLMIPSRSANSKL